eukprot:TRINITY_DN6641_c0_g2_i1.p1 TRINITY_DN6641_c0_g2~~TRINITY_DN6641_c0_g2_i1.p1  ORF type:complete len:390 (-),score=69.88 TRINITY_DN6641_c0_g2_i1:149-1318(-)
MATYCICKKKDEEGVLWISCDGCRGWFHPSCVGLKEEDIDEDKDWFCPLCTDSAGSLSQPLSKEWRRCGRTKCFNFVEGDEVMCIDCKLILVERNSNKLKRMRIAEESRNGSAEDLEIASPVLKRSVAATDRNNPRSPKFSGAPKTSASVSRNQKPKFKVQTSLPKQQRPSPPFRSEGSPVPSSPSLVSNASRSRDISPSPSKNECPKPLNIDHLLFDSPPEVDSVAKRLQSAKDRHPHIRRSPSPPISSTYQSEQDAKCSPRVQTPSTPSNNGDLKRESDTRSIMMPLKKRLKCATEATPLSPSIDSPMISSISSAGSDSPPSLVPVPSNSAAVASPLDSCKFQSTSADNRGPPNSALFNNGDADHVARVSRSFIIDQVSQNEAVSVK